MKYNISLKYKVQIKCTQ